MISFMLKLLLRRSELNYRGQFEDAAFFRFSVQQPHPAPIRADWVRG